MRPRLHWCGDLVKGNCGLYSARFMEVDLKAALADQDFFGADDSFRPPYPPFD